MNAASMPLSTSLPRPSLPVVAAAEAACTPRSEQHTDHFDFTYVGSPEDKPAVPGGGAVLIGGSTDPDPAFRWLGEHAKGGDVLVIGANEDEGYNPYIAGLAQVSSVSTLITHSRQASYDPFVLEQVRNAEAIFLCGGDQADYYNFWQGTPMQEALNEAVARGACIGGTSAGLAVLGQHAFVALTGGVSSPAALADPKGEDMTLATDFLHVPNLEATVTDTHFSARDRMGRLVAFVANVAEHGLPARGIGVDEKTAVMVEPDGQATVTGPGSAWFLRASAPPTRCTAGQALELDGVEAHRVQQGETFDLAAWQGPGGEDYLLSASGGVLSSSAPTPYGHVDAPPTPER